MSDLPVPNSGPDSGPTSGNISQHLPLSQRKRRDETGVTRRWSKHTGTVLLHLAELLEQATPADWQTDSMRDGSTIQDVASSIIWRVGTPARTRALAAARSLIGTGAAAESSTALQPTAIVEQLRAVAIDSLAGRRGARLSDLSAAVVGAYDIASALALPIVVDPVASGAVAVGRAVSAPLPIRAVLGARRLTAVSPTGDPEWSVGDGPELRATAAGIILFLFGRNAATGKLPDPVD